MGKFSRHLVRPVPLFDSTEAICAALREAITSAIPGATVEVTPGGPGHFELRVTSRAFDGKPRVRQQQRVYAAIKDLMQGEQAPVHAIDQLDTRIA